MGISKFFGLEIIITAVIAVSAVPKTNLYFDITGTQMLVFIGAIFLTHCIEVYVENRKPKLEQMENQDIDTIYS